MGSEMTQGLESRMRLGAFLDLMPKHGAEKAAKITRDAFLDYNLTRGNPALYGTLRHVFPFLAFTAQSIPQQASFLARNPAVAVGLAQVFGKGTGSPLLPWISEEPHVPIGKDEEGNDQYLVSLGLPVEVLGDIPNPSAGRFAFGRQARRNVVGMAHPLLKAGVGYLMGEDPFFGSRYGSYDKTPYALQALGAAPNSAVSGAYREIAATGIAQPVVALEQQISNLFDPRKSGMEKLLQALTGARFASNDPMRATLQTIDERLSELPAVRTMEIPYLAKGYDDPLAKALLEARAAAKRQ
jgi:hypothetical protein